VSTVLPAEAVADGSIRGASRRRLLAANGAALVLAYAIPRAFTLLSAVVAARVLGAAVFGWYATAGAVAVVASILATAGMQPLLVREVARDPRGAPRLIGAAHAAKAALILPMVAALALTPFLGLPAPVLLAAVVLGVGYGIGSFVENLAAYFQGVERMHVWAQASAAQGVVTGGAGVVLVLLTRDLLWLCAAPALGQAAALGWLLRRAPAAVRRPPLPSRAELAALFRRLAPFAATFVATTVFYRADVLLLSHWRAPREVGLYSAAYRFLDVAQAVALAAAGALLPHLSRRGGVRAADARRYVLLTAAAAAPFAAALFLLRAPIVRALYGAEYAEAAAFLGVLAPAIVPLAVNMLALAALAAADAMGGVAMLYLGAAALNVALDLAWIPTRGAHGAAWAALLCESALAVGLVLRMRRAR
jgi:O-antigen/teichoic acid export membrane protein